MEKSIEDLDEFLFLAEELELKGLTNSEEEQQEKNIQINQISSLANAHSNYQENKQTLTDILRDFKEVSLDSNQIRTMGPITKLEKFSVSKTENITEKIDSLIEKRDGLWICKVCGKIPSRNDKTEISRHAEVHLQGVAHTCNQCGIAARSSHGLACHVSKFHKV